MFCCCQNAVRKVSKVFLASVFSISSLLLFPPATNAQSPQQVTQITRTLSPDSQKVIERLGSFDQLPAAQWKYHAGDLPHGEAVDFDDANWPVVTARSQGSTEAAWYRCMVEVPKSLNGYDLTGSRIWFQFRATANGPMPQIIYFNGRRVALGDDLEPVVLFDQAKPGDKILVAVKLLQTVDKKTFAGARLKIDFSPARPSPDDLRIEFLTTAALIPSLSKDATRDLATLQFAINTVDLHALDANNPAGFDASLTKARCPANSFQVRISFRLRCPVS